MFDIYSKRLDNVRVLVQKVGGLSAFSDLIEKEKSQISQIAGSNPTRKIGEELARKIEQKLLEKGVKNIYIGWLDKNNNLNDIENFKPFGELVKVPIPSVNSINSKSLEENKMLDEVLMDTMSNMKLNKENAYWLKVTDDSMKPYMQPGTLTMIDTDRKKVEPGSCYALSIEGDIVLRRVYREKGEYKICCDNPSSKINIPDINVSDFDESIKIIGKAVWAAMNL